METKDPNNKSGMSNSGQEQNQNQQGGMNRGDDSNQDNPQEGAQWDNYQTRSLSSEGGEHIEESDLLRADEVSKQNTGSDSGSGR
jgi:hypothetical protein